jgi:hypothetical protein
VTILQQMAEIKSSDKVFLIGRTTLWNLMKKIHPTLTLHGLRSTFRDWAGDVDGSDDELAEISLHHAVGDRTRRAYRRGKALERRRQLMERWQVFCETPFKSNVTVLPDRAA